MPANPAELDSDIVDEKSANLPEVEYMLTVTAVDKAHRKPTCPTWFKFARLPPTPKNAENYGPEYNLFSFFRSKSPLDQQQRRRQKIKRTRTKMSSGRMCLGLAASNVDAMQSSKLTGLICRQKIRDTATKKSANEKA